MNYIQKTPFMELYEELSKLHEAEAVEIMPYDDHQNEQVVSIDELDYFMRNRADELKTAVKNLNRPDIFYKDKSMILFTKVENEPTYYAPGIGWHCSKSASQIDLAPSWLGFLFYLKGQTNIVNELIKQLKSTCSVRLDWSSAKIGKLCPQSGTAKLPKMLYGAYGIFIKYGEQANGSVIAPFVQVVDEAKPVNNVLPFKSRFERAREFIEYFATISKNRFYRPSALETEADIRNCAFHVVDLVSAYNCSDAHLKNCMGSLLDIFGSKIGRKNPDWSTIPDWKSVQYLHNACQQETRLLNIAEKYALEDPNFLLKRNTEATGLDGNNWLLFAQGNENVRGTADFDFIYNNGEVIKVDAKIYYNLASEDKNADKPTAHDAILLIEYIIANGAGQHWKLRPVHSFDSTNFSHKLAERALKRFVLYLNDNKIEFPRIDRNLQSY